jgi:O-antigen/teichoic acid export membrane protein
VAGSAWASRIFTVLVQFASMRVLIDSLGLENYSVFALLSGLVGWFMLADFGVGVSVQNYISESRAKNQSYDYLIVTSIMLAVLLLFATVSALYFVSPYVGPLFLKHFTYLSDEEKTKLFFLTGVLSIGMGVGSIIYKVWYAEQKGYLSNIVPALASIISFIGLLLARQALLEDRLLLSLVAFMAPTAILPLVALGARRLRRGIIHSRTNLPGMSGMIIKRGIQFWFFSIMAAGVLQIDYIVMSQFLTPHDITAYNISTKMFGLAFFIYNAVLFALWPLFAESITKGEWNEVWRYIRKYLILGLVFMFICTLLLLWLMPFAVGMLAPKESIIIPFGFILLLGIYQMIRVWTDTFSMILQSMNDMIPFWILVPIQALISGVLQWMLAPHFGIYGIVLGLIGSFILTVIWGLPLAVRRNYRLSMRG